MDSLPEMDMCDKKERLKKAREIVEYMDNWGFCSDETFFDFYVDENTGSNRYMFGSLWSKKVFINRILKKLRDDNLFEAFVMSLGNYLNGLASDIYEAEIHQEAKEYLKSESDYGLIMVATTDEMFLSIHKAISNDYNKEKEINDPFGIVGGIFYQLWRRMYGDIINIFGGSD
jgi:hypothetical protein